MKRRCKEGDSPWCPMIGEFISTWTLSNPSVSLTESGPVNMYSVIISVSSYMYISNSPPPPACNLGCCAHTTGPLPSVRMCGLSVAQRSCPSLIHYIQLDAWQAVPPSPWFGWVANGHNWYDQRQRTRGKVHLLHVHRNQNHPHEEDVEMCTSEALIR